MTEVAVVEQEAGTYKVTVGAGPGATIHTVRVPHDLPETLGWGQMPVTELVRASFAFLLEREGPESILPAFSLEQIGHYFPEYADRIRRSRPV